MNFTELGAAPFCVEKLKSRGIREPTPVQEKVIPLIAAGKDVLFSSATGSGKTFAYLLPILGNFLKEGGAPPSATMPSAFPPTPSPGGLNAPQTPKPPSGLSVLILAPTYELCSQIKAEADFLAGQDIRVSLLIGQANMPRQIESLKKEKPQIAVGNAGRILLLAKMGKLHLRGLRRIVLDEGDRLFAREAAGETAELLELCRREAGRGGFTPQMISCSATLPPAVLEKMPPYFAADAETVILSPAEVLRRDIEHWAFFAERRRKIGLLRSFLIAAKPKKVLVFTAESGQGGNIVSQLQYHGVAALALHAGMDKQRRKAALDSFRKGSGKGGGASGSVLVSSDLAARGLDIPGVTHVVAMDCPRDEGVYIHRAGRTGRAGRRGVMVTIGDEETMRALSAVEKKLGIAVYPKELYGGKVTSPETEHAD